MGQRILVFESDPGFATEVKSGFARFGAEVEVVADGNEGLERAAANRPDLILLSVELPNVNGFLVCKRIKKTPELADVPLVILSSDPNAEDTFEQHKKLRVRAEEYVRKPVAFGALLSRVRPLLALDEASADEDLAIEDVAIEEVSGSMEVDEEIDAFAESAFESLLSGGGSRASEPAVRRSVPPPSIEQAGLSGLSLAELADEENEVHLRTEPPRAGESQRPSFDAEMDLELGEARTRIAELEAELTTMRGRAEEATRLERELVELKSRSGRPSGGISSREFLDLREALNRKDKEILELRDQLSARDRQLVELRDSGLLVERAKADLEDRVTEQEIRAEQLAADLERTRRQHEEELATHDARWKEELARARTEHAAKLESQEAAHGARVAELTSAHEAELERLRDEQAAGMQKSIEEHASRVARLKAEFEAETAVRAEAAAAEKEQALAELTERLEDEARRRLEEADARRARELAEVEQAAREAMERKVGELEAAHAEAIRAVEERHGNEVARLGQGISDRDRDLAAVRAELGERTAERDTLQAERDQKTQEIAVLIEQRDTLRNEAETSATRVEELEEEKASLEARVRTLEEKARRLEGRLSGALEKIRADQEILERARRAMAIGLGLLEDQRNNALSEDGAALEEAAVD